MDENEYADRLGLADDRAYCRECGADFAADEDCAKGCPGDQRHCGSCGGACIPRWFEVGYRCGACAPNATAADRMRAGEAA